MRGVRHGAQLDTELQRIQNQAAADHLAQSFLGRAGHLVEPLFRPLDVDTIAASVRKTRRLLIVEHGHYTAGYGAHIACEVLQEVQNVKVRRIAFPDAPGPGAAVMMEWMRPDAPKIVDAAVQMVRA